MNPHEANVTDNEYFALKAQIERTTVTTTTTTSESVRTSLLSNDRRVTTHSSSTTKHEQIPITTFHVPVKVVCKYCSCDLVRLHILQTELPKASNTLSEGLLNLQAYAGAGGNLDYIFKK
jgi:hypothetical protein